MKSKIEYYKEIEDSLKVSVKIDHGEILKVVVGDLINKRKCNSNNVKSSFDDVLLYYLGDSDFEKYVIRGDDLS